MAEFLKNFHFRVGNRMFCFPVTAVRVRQSYDFGIQANQLSDILCRGATVSSIQSTNNTLTRNASMRDTGDYDVPHPHPYTHHYMSTSATPQAMSTVGSRPGSAGGSGGSGSSPGGCMSIGSCDGGGSSIAGIMPIGAGVGSGGGIVSYLDCMHYERMPLPVPLPIVPPPQHLMHSEDEIEPAYATGILPFVLLLPAMRTKFISSFRAYTVTVSCLIR